MPECSGPEGPWLYIQAILGSLAIMFARFVDYSSMHFWDDFESILASNWDRFGFMESKIIHRNELKIVRSIWIKPFLVDLYQGPTTTFLFHIQRFTYFDYFCGLVSDIDF